jgi:hypothetical protein
MTVGHMGVIFQSTPRKRPNLFHDLLLYGAFLDRGEILIEEEWEDVQDSPDTIVRLTNPTGSHE